MSQSGQLLPPYLTPEAFAVALEIKEEKGSPYDNGVVCIEKYPKTGTAADKKPFQDQFKELIDKYTNWGRKRGQYTFEIEQHILLMKDQFFHPDYAEKNQDATYFENIKKHLEKILLLLNNEQIDLEKRKKAYKDLCENLGRCAPGLDIHIENAYFGLSSNVSLNYWLAESRIHIIERYADEYNTQYHIPAGNSIHTIKPFLEDAANQNWNPAFSTSHIKDPYAPVITEEIFVDFRKYFISEFNPKAIRACIQLNLQLEMNNIFDSLQFNIQDNWKDTTHTNYTPFTQRATHLINNLGIYSKDGIFDFLESNDDFTQFRLNEDAIVNILCERVLSPALYFDPVNKIYHKLIPYQWIDSRYPLEMIDFSVWNHIPDEIFSSLLSRMLKEIDEKHIKHLLKNIPYEKLNKLNKNEAFVKTLSSIVNNNDKQTYILDKISKILSSPEEKHQFFPPRTNKLLDKLLLHIAYGEQDQAEAMLKINPELLFMSSNVEAPSGDIFMDYSPCRLACHSHDIDMLEMMKRYAHRVPNGDEHFTSLLKEASEAFKNRKTYDFNKLAEIIKNGNDTQIEAALDNFRKKFEPKYIDNKKSFNIENLLKAYEIYINNCNTWSDEKCSLYWCQVIGYLQRVLPACYAQIFTNENNFLTNKGNINMYMYLRRELILCNGEPFYPKSKEKHHGLGFDFAIHHGLGYSGFIFDISPFKNCLAQYMKQKKERCERLSVTPSLSALIYEAVRLSPKEKKDSYFYLLAVLMKNYWGINYKADGVCKEAGILTLESHSPILNGFIQLLGGTKLKFTNDFLYGYDMLPNELKSDYLKLILKQKDFFEKFSILAGEERNLFSKIINEEISGKSFLHYILTECDIQVVRTFMANAFDQQYQEIPTIASAVILIIKTAYETSGQEGVDLFSHLTYKYITYEGRQTNFLGYFILRNSARDDAYYYQQVFDVIPYKILLNCFNTMGIQDFTISLALVEKILNHIPRENISDIFKANFKISDKDKMPTENFLYDLFNILSDPRLTINDITTLLERISYEKLAAIAKSESYATSLNAIKDLDKQALIVATISKIISARECKEEKEEKVAPDRSPSYRRR